MKLTTKIDVVSELSGKEAEAFKAMTAEQRAEVFEQNRKDIVKLAKSAFSDDSDVTVTFDVMEVGE